MAKPLFQRTAYVLRHKRDGRIALLGAYAPFLQWVRPEEDDPPESDFETVRVTVTVAATSRDEETGGNQVTQAIASGHCHGSAAQE